MKPRTLILVGVFLLIDVVIFAIVLWWVLGRSPAGATGATGVWLGTDAYGHRHYFEFQSDGSLTWWDEDRQPDGSFTKRGPFHGNYKMENNSLIASWHGLFAQPLGKLTPVSQDTLKQEGGHAMRDGLVYHRLPSPGP